MKLIKAIERLCPGRITVEMGGDPENEEFFLRLTEHVESTGENSETLEEAWVIYDGHGPYLEKLEKHAVDILNDLEE